MKKTILALAIVGASQSAIAEYQVEIGAGILGGSIDFEDAAGLEDQDYDQTTVGLVGYFDKVSKEAGPYGEAGFLSQNSFAYGRLDKIDYDNSSALDFDATEIGVDYHLEGKPIRLGATLSRIDENNADLNALFIEGGYYTTDRTLLTLQLGAGDGDFDGGGSVDLTSLAVNLHHLTSDEETPVAIDLGYSNAELDPGFDQVQFGAAATVYLSKQLGIGGSIATTIIDYDDDDEEVFVGLSVFTEYWINENIALGAELGAGSGTIENVFGNEFDYDNDYFAVSITGRI
jgi:hypothetical protein